MHENCSCARCTVAFGQNLAQILHTWCEFGEAPARKWHGFVSDVQGSISALGCLQDLVDVDKAASDGAFKVFTPAALDEVEALGLKCGLILKAVVLLIQKAIEDEKRKTNTNVEKDGKEKPKQECKPNLLDGPIPDLASDKMVMGFYMWIDDDCFGYSDRVEHCEAQLRWVKKGLMLQLQIARLARMQVLRPADSEDGAFGLEAGARCAVSLLRASRIKHARHHARKQEKAQRQRDLEAKREADEKVSIRSGSSGASARTVVDEGAPVVKSTGEKENTVVKTGYMTPPAAMHMAPPVAMPLPPGVGNLPAAVPGIGAQTTTQDTQHPAMTAVTHVEVAQGSKESKSKSASVSTSINNLSQKLSETMTEFTHKIFGKDDMFKKDWSSEKLEAWVMQNAPFDQPMKVPFGHQRLQYGLKKVNSKNSDDDGLTTFDRYVNQSARVQILLDEMKLEANRMKKRERVCLAFRLYVRPDKTSFVIAFFSILDEQPPVSFIDCIGRKMSLPYEVCKTWTGMRNIIRDALRHVPEVGLHVLRDHYDVLDVKGETILKTLWDATIKPGDSIKMVMWPMLSHPVPPMFPHVPPDTAATNAHARLLRLNRWPSNPPPGGMPPGFPCRMPGMPMGPPRFPGAGLGMPPPCMPGPPPNGIRGPGVSIQPRRRASVSSFASSYLILSDDGDPMTWEEEKELTFVDFVEELEKARELTVPKMLARFTNLKDVTGAEVFESTWGRRDGSMDTDSDSSGTSGSESSYRGRRRR